MYTLEAPQNGLGIYLFSCISQEEAESIIAVFLDLGGHYVETAPSHLGCNVNTGSLISKSPREELLVGAKGVLNLDENGAMYHTGRPENVRVQCLRGMQRLGVEYLNLPEAHYIPVDMLEIVDRACTDFASEIEKACGKSLEAFPGLGR